ncbi:uncharacterized protein [Panulirus ornatus]|uniref:uncharacterized protein n=1 Tax=Panulirus ornatus TaxID=150431 RepID=UPI003A84A52A
MKGVLLPYFLLLGLCDASAMGPIESLKEGPQETMTPKHPDSSLSELGEAIVTAMHDMLVRQERSINDRLKQLELYVDRTCGNSQALDTDFVANTVRDTTSDTLDRFMEKMSSMAVRFANDLRRAFHAEVHQLVKRLEEQRDSLATKSDLQEMQVRSCADARNTLYEDNGKAFTPASDGVVDELGVANHLLASILTLMGNVSSADVFHYTRKISRSLESLEPLYQDLVKVTKTCIPREEELRNLSHLGALLQQLTEEVDENGNALSGMTLALEDAEHMLVDRLQTLEDLTQQLTDSMAISSPDMTSESDSSTTTPGAVSACLNSQFIGVQAYGDLCSTAVRYKKCSLQIVAYHCCQTCTEARQIPEMGPHRFLHYPRRVSLFLGR